MPAGSYDIRIEQGATYALLLTITQNDGITPLNLTNYTGKSQLKKSYAATELPIDFDVTIIDPVAGKLSLGMTAEKTADLAAAANLLETKPQYVYDLKITSPAPNSKVSRILKGRVFVSPEVTRNTP